MKPGHRIGVFLLLFALTSVALFVFAAPGASAGGGAETPEQSNPEPPDARADAATSPAVLPDELPEGTETAVFAGGCFWCMEEAYEQVPGVAEVVSGYAGGTEASPEYTAVASGRTSHYEVVRVYYDPEIVTYEDLLYVFWRNVDPTDPGGQFCDRGPSYRTAIFVTNETERRLAEESKANLAASGELPQPIVTPILALDVIEDDENDGFWPAEEYHQEYYERNAVRYNFYKTNCGRERRLQQIWGDEAGAPSLKRDA